MKYCEHCKVKVNTDKKICPLCFNSLKEMNTPNDKELNYANYPNRKVKVENHNLFYKIIIFLCAVSILSSLLIDFVTHKEGNKWWSIYVVLSVGYLYTLFRGAILARTYVIKRLLLQLVVMSILLWGIDVLSDYIGWSLAIVIPCLCTATNITNMIITLINHKSFNDGFSSIMFCLFLGVVPFILQLFDLIKGEDLWAPLASAAFSIVVFLAIVVFAGKAFKEELYKRFHV